jgi:hypothetical protein
VRCEDLGREEPDQSQADHHEALPQGRLAQSHAVKSDRRKRGKCCSFKGDLVADRGHEIARDRHEFGMGTVGGNPTPHRQPDDTVTDSRDDPGVAVPEGHRLTELVPHSRGGGSDPVGPRLVQNLPNLLRLLTGLLTFGRSPPASVRCQPRPKRPPCERGRSRAHVRGRQSNQLSLAGIQVLEELAHAPILPPRAAMDEEASCRDSLSALERNCGDVSLRPLGGGRRR